MTAGDVMVFMGGKVKGRYSGSVALAAIWKSALGFLPFTNSGASLETGLTIDVFLEVLDGLERDRAKRQ